VGAGASQGWEIIADRGTDQRVGKGQRLAGDQDAGPGEGVGGPFGLLVVQPG
jgi:hypothetical protein